MTYVVADKHGPFGFAEIVDGLIATRVHNDAKLRARFTFSRTVKDLRHFVLWDGDRPVIGWLHPGDELTMEAGSHREVHLSLPRR